MCNRPLVVGSAVQRLLVSQDVVGQYMNEASFLNFLKTIIFASLIEVYLQRAPSVGHRVSGLCRILHCA